MKPEIKTEIELLNGRITEATGFISVEYAKTQLNKKWISLESLKEILDTFDFEFGISRDRLYKELGLK